jgi:hypothetical protein
VKACSRRSISISASSSPAAARPAHNISKHGRAQSIQQLHNWVKRIYNSHSFRVGYVNRLAEHLPTYEFSAYWCTLGHHTIVAASQDIGPFRGANLSQEELIHAPRVRLDIPPQLARVVFRDWADAGNKRSCIMVTKYAPSLPACRHHGRKQKNKQLQPPESSLSLICPLQVGTFVSGNATTRYIAAQATPHHANIRAVPLRHTQASVDGRAVNGVQDVHDVPKLIEALARRLEDLPGGSACSVRHHAA